jgi:hypothetical protein
LIFLTFFGWTGAIQRWLPGLAAFQTSLYVCLAIAARLAGRWQRRPWTVSRIFGASAEIHLDGLLGEMELLLYQQHAWGELGDRVGKLRRAAELAYARDDQAERRRVLRTARLVLNETVGFEQQVASLPNASPDAQWLQASEQGRQMARLREQLGTLLRSEDMSTT